MKARRPGRAAAQETPSVDMPHARATRGWPARVLFVVIAVAVASLGTHGACIAYEGSLRSEVTELRAELESYGAVLDLRTYVEAMAPGDPRTADFLRVEPDLPPAGTPERDAFEARVLDLGPIDVRGEVLSVLERASASRAAGTEWTTPTLPAPGYVKLVEALLEEARASAESDTPAAIVRRLELTVHVVAWFPSDAGTVLWLSRCRGEWSLLEQVEAVLPWLPDELELAALERHLHRPDAGLDIERALRGDLALSLEVLPHFEPEGLLRYSTVPRVAALRMERELLGAFACLFGWLQASPSVLRNLDSESYRPRPISGEESRPTLILVPRWLESRGCEYDHRAQRDFALAALAARRGGHEAARAALASRVDLAGGLPYLAEVDEDGWLELSCDRDLTPYGFYDWPPDLDVNEGGFLEDVRWRIPPERDRD